MYALLGFRAGFRHHKGFSLFLEGNNLTDQRYASAIDIIADAHSGRLRESFIPTTVALLRWNFVESVNRKELPLVTRRRLTVASSRTDPS